MQAATTRQSLAEVLLPQLLQLTALLRLRLRLPLRLLPHR